jgi:hypothetical protein
MQSPTKKQKVEPQVYPYIRVNHFAQYIEPYVLQEEHVVIPDHLIKDLKKEFAKNRYKNVRMQDHMFIKRCLSRCNYKNMDKYIPSIIAKLNTTEPIGIRNETAEKLKAMFDKILEPYEKVLPTIYPSRKSFFGYGYVLYKLAELIEDPIIIHLGLLKSREKMLCNDRLWKAVCEETGWKYIPTI